MIYSIKNFKSIKKKFIISGRSVNSFTINRFIFKPNTNESRFTFLSLIYDQIRIKRKSKLVCFNIQIKSSALTFYTRIRDVNIST